MPRLYGSLDRTSGHYRRYRKSNLESLVSDAGFTIDTLRHFDVAGVAPYWVAVHRAEMRSLSSTITALFDRVLVPISRCTYQFLPGLDSGKNLVLIATAEHPMA